jgi:hypothetical protein
MVIIRLMQCKGKLSLVFNALAICGFVMALPVVAPASTKIIVCSSCDPPPVTLTASNGALGEVQASTAAENGGNQTVEYLNETGSIIDDLVFSTTINAGLSVSTLQKDGDFECDAPDGFFLECSVVYDPATGQLTLAYYDVNPPNILDTPGFVLLENIFGLGSGDTGIPEGGLFEIQLSGWTTVLNDPNLATPTNPTGQIYGAPPELTNGFNVPVPEASTILIFLTELSLLAGALFLVRRKLNWKTRFEL